MTTFSFLAPGIFSIVDNGNPGDGISSIFKDGVFVQNFALPADELVFRASVPGITILFDLTEALGNADLRIETPPASSQLPENIVVRTVRTSGDVNLIAINSIIESGSDSAVDIVAGSLILSAGTGVGTAANAIETQAGILEAETVTGGINISNVGSVVVGGLTDDVAGLRVVTSGDIRLVNLGSITIADETEADSIRGGSASGDVILTAYGFDADLTTSVNQSSILAQGGDILLTAGRDVLFGRTGTNFNDDVRADGDIVVNAGRNFELSGFADFFADGVTGSSGGSVIITAGNDVSLLSANGTSAGLRSSGSGGGDVVLTTGPNGTFTHQTAGSNAVTSFSGDVFVNADRMVIGAISGITAFGQTVLRPATPGREIILGSLTDAAAALELSDAELDRIFGDNLIVGGTDAGLVRAGAPISPGNIDNWTLHGGTDLLLQSSLTVTGRLSLIAGDSLFQTAGTLQAEDLEMFVDQNQADDGAGGTNILFGSVSATTVSIFGGPEADLLNGTALSDLINGTPGNDIMTGGLGNDVYRVHNPGDVVVEAGGEGTDTVISTAPLHVLADNVEKLLLGGSSNIDGTGNGLANDIVGNSGNNELRGGSGADDISGGDGNDLIDGESGHDTLEGGAGSDTLIGGSHGIDRLDGGSGADTMIGGNGNDIYVVDNPGDVVTEVSGAGNDTVETGLTYTLPTHVERLELTGVFHKDGTGNNAANRLTGNSGKNTLKGLGGNDQLDGGDKGDQLFGGTGNDMLTGGAGIDRFFFDSAPWAGNADSILDFSVPEDEIRLDRADFAGFAVNGTLSASAFKLGATPGDADDRIMYDSTTGQIFHDADGTGAAPTLLFAAVTAGTPLTNADFILFS